MSRSGGELVPLRRTLDHDELRLEPLTAGHEAEAAELLVNWGVRYRSGPRRLVKPELSELRRRGCQRIGADAGFAGVGSHSF